MYLELVDISVETLAFVTPLVEIVHLFGQLDASTNELHQMVTCMLEEFVGKKDLVKDLGSLLHMPIGEIMKPSGAGDQPWGRITLKSHFTSHMTEDIKKEYANLKANGGGRYVRRTVTDMTKFRNQVAKNMTDHLTHQEAPIVDGKLLFSRFICFNHISLAFLNASNSSSSSEDNNVPVDVGTLEACQLSRGTSQGDNYTLTNRRTGLPFLGK